jgi:hypothetical protein
MKSKSGSPPELQVLEIKDAFVHASGKMSIELTSAISVDCKNESSKSSDNDSNEVSKDVSNNTDAISTLLGQIQFPLLHKLGMSTDVNFELINPRNSQAEWKSRDLLYTRQ